MHNTIIEYKPKHNKTKKWQLNTYLYLFHGYSPSWSFNFIIFFIHNNIISYPNAKMDKRFFNNWVLHIPRRLWDLLWIMSAWSSVSPIFSSLIMGQASSCVCSFQILSKVITSLWHTFLEWMNPMIQGGHSRWLSQLPLLILLLQVVLWFERPF